MFSDEFILLLIVISFCLLLATVLTMTKLYRMKQKVRDMEDILADIQAGNENRKILINETNSLASLAYQVNEILYDCEKKVISLKKADQTSKQLMTSLSHDVRTPLTTLIGYLDAAHTGIVSGAERESYIETARRKAYDLKDYIDILFDWFRLNSDEFTLSIEPIEIAELTRNLLKDWIPVFREKNLAYEIEIPDRQIMAKVDLDGYSRVINNLVQNVVSHSQADKIDIAMEVCDNEIRIRITDNGVGMDKDDLQHIFERLYKCDKGRSEKGSGLGMSIVLQIVEKMGGSICADSEKDKYTTFTVKFLPIS